MRSQHSGVAGGGARGGIFEMPPGPPAEGGPELKGPPKNWTNVMNCPDKLTNASEYTKLNIDFQNFLGGDTPEPASWRGKEHTWEGKARPSEFFSAGRPDGVPVCFIPKAGLKNVRTCSAEQGPPNFRGPHTCKKLYVVILLTEKQADAKTSSAWILATNQSKLCS